MAYTPMKIRIALLFLLAFSKGPVWGSTTEIVKSGSQDLTKKAFVNVTIQHSNGDSFMSDVKINFNVDRSSKPTLDQLKQELAGLYGLQSSNIIKMYVKDTKTNSQQDITSIEALQNDDTKVIFVEVPNEVKVKKKGDTNPDEDDGLLNKLNVWHWISIVAVVLCLAGSLWWFLKVRKAPSSKKKSSPSNKSNQPENKQASQFQIGYRWR